MRRFKQPRAQVRVPHQAPVFPGRVKARFIWPSSMGTSSLRPCFSMREPIPTPPVSDTHLSMR